MRKVLEVIALSVADAQAAEAGGADRLELVRDLGAGGLTPAINVVEAILAAVRIPVRVMLRENATMEVADAKERARLIESARELARLPIDGMVSGFLREGNIDREMMQEIFEAAPESRFTFHRAFEELPDKEAGLAVLKEFPQVDRILTKGGRGDWARRKAHLTKLQTQATPEITILAGAGLSMDVVRGMAETGEIREVHVGRAARTNQSVQGAVDRAAVEAVRTILR